MWFGYLHIEFEVIFFWVTNSSENMHFVELYLAHLAYETRFTLLTLLFSHDPDLDFNREEYDCNGN